MANFIVRRPISMGVCQVAGGLGHYRLSLVGHPGLHWTGIGPVLRDHDGDKRLQLFWKSN